MAERPIIRRAIGVADLELVEGEPRDITFVDLLASHTSGGFTLPASTTADWSVAIPSQAISVPVVAAGSDLVATFPALNGSVFAQPWILSYHNAKALEGRLSRAKPGSTGTSSVPVVVIADDIAVDVTVVVYGTGGGSGPALSDADPLANGAADPGVSPDVSRADHVHPGGPGGGVQGVTGDGINNADPANPVSSWPTPGDIGAAEPGDIPTDLDGLPDGAARFALIAAERSKLTGIAPGAQVNLPVGTTAGTVLAGNDPSTTNARTPTAHATSHATGGSDPVTPAAIGAATAAQGVLAGTAIQPGNPALTDARVPLAHNQSASTITTGTLAAERVASGTPTAGYVATSAGAGVAPTWSAATGGGGGGGGVPLFGGAYTFQPRLDRTYWAATPQSGATMRMAGVGDAAALIGTVTTDSAVNASGFSWTRFTTAASVYTNALIYHEPAMRGGTVGDAAGGWVFHACVRFPDADYSYTGTSTGTTIVIGGGQSIPASTGCLFRYDTQSPGAATWTFTVVGAAPVDVLTPFVTGNVYDMWIRVPIGGGIAYWQIADKTAGTTQYGSVATSLSASSLIYGTASVFTHNAVARAMQLSRILHQSEEG